MFAAGDQRVVATRLHFNHMIIWGSKGVEKTLPGGNFFCPKCRLDAAYTRIRVARYFTLYFIPLFETRVLGEYVRCGHCASNLSTQVLSFSREQILLALEPWKCESCNNQNPTSENQCLGCGAARRSGPPPLPSGPPPPPPAESPSPRGLPAPEDPY
ncbi:MAG: zinc-ribbon domain-containing protein [Chthoniobacter sp.]|nr:zinc-ribbon domain-containing protein [Chthoniobacter sp.]